MGPALRDFWPTASPFDGRGAILSAEKKNRWLRVTEPAIRLKQMLSLVSFATC